MIINNKLIFDKKIKEEKKDKYNKDLLKQILFRSGFSIYCFRNGLKYANYKVEKFIRRIKKICNYDLDKILNMLLRFFDKKNICIVKPIRKKQSFLLNKYLFCKLQNFHKIGSITFIFDVKFSKINIV